MNSTERELESTPANLGEPRSTNPTHGDGAIDKLLEVLQEQQRTLQTQERLLRRQERIQSATADHLDSIAELVRGLVSQSRSISTSMEYLEGAVLAPTMDEAWNFLSTNQLSLHATLLRLVDSEVSFARFGDGEFKLMLSAWRNLAFQENSFELIADLERVAASRSDSLLVGMPQFMRNDNYLKLWPKIWGRLRTLLDDSAVYGNSHVSRPLAFKFMGATAVELWREVWRNKNICIVTGEGSRFELLPVLFDSASNTARINSSPVNAYSDITRISAECHASDADMFLVSLGPAGTILSQKLATQGRRALDIGHLSAAYLNIFEGQSSPESTPHTRIA